MSHSSSSSSGHDEDDLTEVGANLSDDHVMELAPDFNSEVKSLSELEKIDASAEENNKDKVEALQGFFDRYQEKYDKVKHEELLSPQELFHTQFFTICRQAGTRKKSLKDEEKELFQKKIQEMVDEFIDAIFDVCKYETFSDQLESLKWLQQYHSKNETTSLLTDQSELEIALVKVFNVAKIEEERLIPCTAIIYIFLKAYTNTEPREIKTLGKEGGFEGDFNTNWEVKKLYDALDSHIKDDIVLHSFLSHFHDSLIQEHLKENIFYARSISFLNSSGMGKSRLVRNIGLFMPSFTIILESREEGEGRESIPQTDTQVVQFFKYAGEHFPGQVVAAAFLSALFNQLYIFVALFYQHSDSLTLAPPQQVSKNAETQRECYEHVMKMAREATNRADTIFATKVEGKTLQKDVCELICFKLRQTSHNEDRNLLLGSVVSLATAILEINCKHVKPYKKERPSQDFITRQNMLEKRVNNEREKEALPRIRRKTVKHVFRPLYLDFTELLSNLDRFFGLVDSFRDPVKEEGLTQFVFGIDECHYLNRVLVFDSVDEYKDDEENIHMERSDDKTGVHAFTRLLHDLENPPEYADHNSKSEEWARRRLWVAFLDTSNRTGLLIPYIRAESTEPFLTTELYSHYTSKWHNFGSNHAFHRKEIVEPEYLTKIKIATIHRFRHLSLFGRGMWDADGRPNTVIDLSVKKLLCTSTSEWKDVPLFASPIDFKDIQKWYNVMHQFWSESISDITYTVASLRFNTDTGVMVQREDYKSYTVVSSSITHHMRVIVKIGKNGGLITSTPCEPILAVGALALLNYFKRDFDYTRSLRPSTDDYLGTKHDDGWKNLLKEMIIAFKNNRDLINVGDAGELIGRMILTRARDCTLPEYWDFSKTQAVPYTTLAQFLYGLVGDEIVGTGEGDDGDVASGERCIEVIIKRLMKVNSRLPFALVNFNQFIPIDGPLRSSSSNYEPGGPLFFGQLGLAFTQGVALICYPGEGEPGINHVIPIMVPKQVDEPIQMTTGPLSQSEEDDVVKSILMQSTDDIEKANAAKTLNDYDLAYVGIDNKLTSNGQFSNKFVTSPELVNHEGDIVQLCAAVVITMDVGASDRFRKFNQNDPPGCDYRKDRLTGCLKVDIQKKVEEKVETIDEGVLTQVLGQQFLALRIRGLNEAYPNWHNIDKNGEFQEAVYASVLGKTEEYDEVSVKSSHLHEYTPSLPEFLSADRDYFMESLRIAPPTSSSSPYSIVSSQPL